MRLRRAFEVVLEEQKDILTAVAEGTGAGFGDLGVR